MKSWRITISLVLGLLLTACLPSTPEPTPTPTPTPTVVPTTSEALTVAAWKALETQPEAAIEYCQKCIDLFEDEAIKQQEAFTEPPPFGKVNEEQKKAIFSNWALNDVATCYFIMGQALAKLGRIDDAKEAYRGAQKFPYARTWDPSWEGFWSPAEGASKELSKME